MTTITQYNLDNPPVGLAPISLACNFDAPLLSKEIRSRFSALANLRTTLLLGTDVYEEIEFDSKAPIITNKRMLEYAGVKLRAPVDVPTHDINAHLTFLINCLAALNVHLTNTNHLNDIDLYILLFHEILEEEIPFLPPSVGVTEFIDMNYNRAPADPVVDRDSTLPQPPSGPIF